MLGLPAGSVRNIIMHRDIVPRAFMCDYTIVADLLQRWVPSFKSHKGLAAHHSHKVLYTFVGDMQVRGACLHAIDVTAATAAVVAAGC